jgi:hypothetical protein
MIAATDRAKVQAVLTEFAGLRIGVAVEAAEVSGFHHANTIWLQVASK